MLGFELPYGPAAAARPSRARHVTVTSGAIVAVAGVDRLVPVAGGPGV